MNISTKKTSNWYRRFPFQWNLLFLLLIGVSLYLIKEKYFTSSDEDSFYLLSRLLIRLFLGFSLVVFIYALISSLLPYLLFKFYKNKKDFFQIKQSAKGLELTHSLPFYLFPFLGKLKYSLTTNDNYATEVMNFSYFKKAIKIPFPHIDEYTLSHIRLYFIDSISLFQWNESIPFFNKWWQSEFQDVSLNQEFSPAMSEDDTNRTQNIINAPGEWLNQKNYEYGDDVRRIIWKIYAKNKTLQVKTQEIKTPYAQKISFYIDWTTDIDVMLDKNELSQSLLDYYKSFIIAVIQKSINDGYSVQVKSYDQLYDDITNIKKMIIAAKWIEAEVNNSIIPAKSIQIIHSMIPNKRIDQLINNQQEQIYCCNLSHLLSTKKDSIIKQIFVKKENEWQSIQNSFTLRNLSKIIKTKEQNIESITQ